MTLRSVAELTDVQDPAWPEIAALVGRHDSARALPIDRSSGETSLHALQVTAASPLGALALNCGGILIDHGWFRLLGGGAPGLPSLSAANGWLDATAAEVQPAFLTVALDVLGGRFAIDGGGLGINPGKVCYWAVDTLAWEDTGLGHGAFVHAFINGAAAEFYGNFLWPGWAEEVGALGLDQGLSLWPPPFSTEGQDLAAVSRRAVPLAELHTFYADASAQL